MKLLAEEWVPDQRSGLIPEGCIPGPIYLLFKLLRLRLTHDLIEKIQQACYEDQLLGMENGFRARYETALFSCWKAELGSTVLDDYRGLFVRRGPL